MRIDILMIGRIHEKHYKVMFENYLKRCSGRLQIGLINCKDKGEMEKRIVGFERVAALDEKGKNLDSVQFSDWLGSLINSGVNRLAFCLGEADGLSCNVKNRATEMISLSRLTMNHELALTVLSEQLYRSLSILFGEPYHKS